MLNKETMEIENLSLEDIMKSLTPPEPSNICSDTDHFFNHLIGWKCPKCKK